MLEYRSTLKPILLDEFLGVKTLWAKGILVSFVRRTIFARCSTYYIHRKIYIA